MPELNLDEQSLDLREQAPAAYQLPPAREYDPGPLREFMRSAIALALLLIIGILAGWLLLLFGRMPDKIESIVQMGALLFAPLIGLLGTAIGFYFGSQAARGARE